MHGCFRAGNNQVMIEFGKPNCQLLASRKDLLFSGTCSAQVYPGAGPSGGIHWLVHLVLLHAGLGPEQHAWGAPGESSSIWGSGKWERSQMWEEQATDVAFRDQLGGPWDWASDRVGDPGKSGHLSTGSRKWAVPVTLGLKLLQMQCFWHTETGSCLVSLNLEVSLSLRIMASDMHMGQYSPQSRS